MKINTYHLIFICLFLDFDSTFVFASYDDCKASRIRFIKENVSEIPLGSEQETEKEETKITMTKAKAPIAVVAVPIANELIAVRAEPRFTVNSEVINNFHFDTNEILVDMAVLEENFRFAQSLALNRERELSPRNCFIFISVHAILGGFIYLMIYLASRRH